VAETPLRDAIQAALASDPEVPATMLNALAGGQRPRPQDVARLTEKARGSLRAREVAKLRAQAVLDAASEVQARAGYVPVALPSGRVLEFESVTPAPGYPEGTAVLIRPRGVGPDGGVIVVNPPTLVPDPGGDIVVRGRRHREDPLGALAVTVQRVYGQGA